MIDLFSLGVSHGLIMLAAWRLLARADLDRDDLDQNNTKSAAPDGARSDA